MLSPCTSGSEPSATSRSISSSMTAVSTASTSVLPSAMFTGVERIGEMVSTPGTAARSPSMVVPKPPLPHEPESTT